MFASRLRMGSLLLAVCVCVCSCSNDELPRKTAQTEKDTQAAREPAVPVQAPLIGQPTGSGYADESIRVQIGPDESLRELHSPADGHQFLLVRLAVNGKATLVPGDYRLDVNGKTYQPHAVGFGRPNGVYASVRDFVGPRVELVPGEADQQLHDGQKIQQGELANLMVFLAYDVPTDATPTLWHGARSFALAPNLAALAADLEGSGGTLTASNQLNLPSNEPQTGGYAAELIHSTRTRASLNSTPVEVVVLTIGLTAEKSATIELAQRAISLQGENGSSGNRTLYFDFGTTEADPTAGSSIIPGETYEGRELVGLDSGSFRVTLPAGKTANVTLLFPNPPAAGDLTLQLSPEVALAIPEPVNPLGKFVEPLERLPAMVAWEPLIGSPLDAGYLTDRASIAKDAKPGTAPTPANPGDGLKFLVVRFRVDREGPLVPVDYRLADPESNTIYRPLAVGFGESPTYVNGLDYEKLPLKFGPTTEPTRTASRLAGWTLSTKEVAFLYEVSPTAEFVFLHGTTQFVIEP